MATTRKQEVTGSEAYTAGRAALAGLGLGRRGRDWRPELALLWRLKTFELPDHSLAQALGEALTIF